MKKKLLIEASIEVKSSEPAEPTFPVYPGKRTLTPSLPGEAVALREARRINDSSFARLWKYLYEPNKNILLTDHEEEMRLRLANVWSLLTGKVLNDRKAVLAHTTWCKDNFMQITERTAYDDVRRAKALFGDPRANAAIFEKARISTILLDQMQVLKSISETGNTIDKIEAAKAINQITRRYNAVNGLEDDIKTQLPRAAISITFNADPETLRKQAEELMDGVTIDAEFTEEK